MKNGGKNSIGLHGAEVSLEPKPSEGMKYKYVKREERERRRPKSDG